MEYQKLPVYRQRKKILKALKSSQVIVVESPTGSGKTTQLPIILDEAGYTKKGLVGITQPRRIATLSVSDFMSKQLKGEVGSYVGYKMRFDDITSEKTKLKVMTDGILLQEIKHDPLLKNYSAIIVDEAHERSLNIDFILGLLKTVLEERNDFKVIISSATMNTDIFSTYFSGCPIIHIDTEMFPVELIHVNNPENEEDLVFRICEFVDKLQKKNHEGDILIFLSGEKIIKDCISGLYTINHSKKLKILGLYGRLSKEEQEKVFIPAEEGITKVIVSTNIAETSVTIDGVTVVIDSGLGKLNYYSPKTFTSSLREQMISKASCEQRKGRAGRTRPGICYRLYSKSDFANRQMYTQEEIYRTDLSEVILRMAELGIKDYNSFDFISPPGKEGIFGAIDTLKSLDALDSKNELTDIGRAMFPYPLQPKHSRILIEGIRRYPDIITELTIIVSFLTTHSPYVLPQGEEFAARKAHSSFKHEYGDFLSYISLYKIFVKAKDKEKYCNTYFLDYRTMKEIVNISHQLQEIISEQGIPLSSNKNPESILKAVCAGLIQFVCVKNGKYTYQSITADKIQIHPGSVLFKDNPEFMVAGEIVKTSKLFARSVSVLEKRWINQIKPNLLDILHKRGTKKDKAESRKDTTWQLSVGPVSFKLVPFKGKKKLAVVDWSNLKTSINSIQQKHLYSVGSLRAVLFFKGKELIKNHKLTRILMLLKNYDLDNHYIQNLNKKNFYLFKNIKNFPDIIADIFKITQHNKRSFGFTALETDRKGTYWFKVYDNFLNALEISIANISWLIDETPKEFEKILAEKAGRIYRKLSFLYDNIFLI